MHVERYGHGGAPIVLLHGFGTSSFLWRNIAPEIALANRTAFAVDLFGYGESDRPFFAARPKVSRAMAGSSPQGVIVLAVESDRMLLNAGQSQGVRKGMRFAIHRPTREVGTTSE